MEGTLEVLLLVKGIASLLLRWRYPYNRKWPCLPNVVSRALALLYGISWKAPIRSAGTVAKSIMETEKISAFFAGTVQTAFSLMITVCFAAFPDFLICEISGSILVGFLEEDPQHIHIECFSKAPGMGKQRNNRNFIQKVPDHQCLVNVIILCRCLSIVRNANG